MNITKTYIHNIPILDILIYNKDCRVYSKYYDTIYNYALQLTNCINYLQQNTSINKIQLYQIKVFVLHEINKMLEYIKNARNDSLKTINMISMFSNNNNQESTESNIDFNNIASHIEYIDLKLLELFEKYVFIFQKYINNIT